MVRVENAPGRRHPSNMSYVSCGDCGPMMVIQNIPIVHRSPHYNRHDHVVSCRRRPYAGRTTAGSCSEDFYYATIPGVQRTGRYEDDINRNGGRREQGPASVYDPDSQRSPLPDSCQSRNILVSHPDHIGQRVVDVTLLFSLFLGKPLLPR